MIRRVIYFLLFVAVTMLFTACGRTDSQRAASAESITTVPAKITFIELGSVTCIPCKKMQPVMKSIETRYAGQVKVIFHDVMKDRSQSQKYGIKLIPTQVFLDSAGTEVMRHEGFFAEEEIDKFLRKQGLTPQS